MVVFLYCKGKQKGYSFCLQKIDEDGKIQYNYSGKEELVVELLEEEGNGLLR